MSHRGCDGQGRGEDLFQRLTGQEDGLAGLWNFDDPARPGRDATPNHFDAQLRFNARLAPAAIPSAEELGNPTLIVGRVTDSKGELLTEAMVRFEPEGQPAKEASVNDRSEFRMLLQPTDRPVSVSAKSFTPERRSLGLFLTNRVFKPGESRLDLKLREFASLSGSVVAFDQTPLRAVVVQALSQRPPLELMTNGLLGEYFRLKSRPERFPDLADGAVPDATNRVSKIQFPKGRGWLPFKGVGENEFFYGRWTGTFTLDQSLRIDFELIAGPGVRLLIDGKTAIDLGVIGSGSQKGETVTLEAGEHRVKIDALRRTPIYYVMLNWQLEGFAPSPFPLAKPFKAAVLTDDKREFRFGELPPRLTASVLKSRANLFTRSSVPPSAESRLPRCQWTRVGPPTSRCSGGRKHGILNSIFAPFLWVSKRCV